MTALGGGTAAERVVRERIRSNGPLTFAEFMATALYDSRVGYYARADSPFGARGDYFTSPELHPGFAALLARQLEQLWPALERPEPFVIHETGAGSGLFARDLLDRLRAARPELYAALEYRLDEAGPALRRAQEARLARAGHLERVAWVEGFAPGARVHCVLANELIDALPVHLVEVRDGRLRELYVGLDGQRLALRPGELSTPRLEAYFERLGLRPAEGNRAEVNLAALEWLGRAAGALARGLLVLLDYGYPAEHLYGPARRHGTLLCYYRHTLNSDPLLHVGEQDITSHVDFTSLARAGEAAGLTTLGLVSQRRLLTNLGWEGLRQSVAAAAVPWSERTANLRALDALVEPGGLGRVLGLVQQRGLGNLAPWCLVGTGPMDWAPIPLRGPEHLRLPDPAEADGLADFEAQWAELLGEAEEGPGLPAAE